MRPCESVIIFLTCAVQVLILTATQLRKCEVCFAGAAQMAVNGLIVPEETTCKRCKRARKMLSMRSRRGGLAGGGIVQTLLSGGFHSFVPEAHWCPFELGGWVKWDFPCASAALQAAAASDEGRYFRIPNSGAHKWNVKGASQHLSHWQRAGPQPERMSARVQHSRELHLNMALWLVTRYQESSTGLNLLFLH